MTELPFDTVLASYRCVYLAGKAVYVQGHKGFSSFSPDKAVLFVEKRKLAIEGEELHIKQLSSDDIMITGKIRSITVID